MAPAEAAQEGPRRGRRLDHAAQHPAGPSGSQRVGVVDAVAPGQRGGHQGQQLVPGIGPARGVAQVNEAVRQFTQTQAEGEAGGQQQPGIGHQAVVVESDVDAIGVLAW